MDEHVQHVPQENRDAFRAIVALIDEFCDEHLDAEYRQLSREMAVVLCQRNSPARRGKPASWASGVVYSVGWVNFLSDASEPPYMSAADVAKGFGVSESTMLAKARVIREGLNLFKLDPDWCTERLLAENPLAWMIEVNGMLLDLRHAPREVQVKAYEKGLIPYVPADRDGGEPDAKVIAHIGPEEATRTVHSTSDRKVANPDDVESSLFAPQPAKPSRRRAKSRANKKAPEVYELKITLRDTEPPIWRGIAVPGDISLAKLHDVIQIVMGWEDCHLHQFTSADGAYFGPHDPGLGLDMEVLDERRYRLHDIVDRKGARLSYEYDFGDSWEHQIQVVKIEPPKPDGEYPLCRAGKLACPPEDCGGVWGYYDMLDAIADPKHERHEEMTEWLRDDFDPQAFDRDAVNERLAALR